MLSLIQGDLAFRIGIISRFGKETQWLMIPPENMDVYKKIVYILECQGDILGCGILFLKRSTVPLLKLNTVPLHQTRFALRERII